ncbi:unnamed protein product [Arctogadus glacialis]
MKDSSEAAGDLEEGKGRGGVSLSRRWLKRSLLRALRRPQTGGALCSSRPGTWAVSEEPRSGVSQLGSRTKGGIQAFISRPCEASSNVSILEPDE